MEWILKLSLSLFDENAPHDETFIKFHLPRGVATQILKLVLFENLQNSLVLRAMLVQRS